MLQEKIDELPINFGKSCTHFHIALFFAVEALIACLVARYN